MPSGELLNRREPFAAEVFADLHEAESNGKKMCITAVTSYYQDTTASLEKVRWFVVCHREPFSDALEPVGVLCSSCGVEKVKTS